MRKIQKSVLFPLVAPSCYPPLMWLLVCRKDQGSLAATNARLIAMEPEPESAALLRAGVQLNKLDFVEVVEAAASSQTGKVDFARFRAEVSRSALMPKGTIGQDAHSWGHN